MLRIFVLSFALFCPMLLCLPGPLFSKSVQYDIAYIWDDDLNNVLDYQNQLEETLGPEVALHLRIVGKKEGGYGIVYDHNGTALSSAQLMVKHSEMLRSEGLSECSAVEDNGYFELYNVSYGLGPNLEDMKKRYARVYNYLGDEVGKSLYIEQTDKNNYTLIYRRRGDRSSTYKVARNHAKLLKKRRISTTILAEKNNPVVFGESSHLDDQQPTSTSVPAVASTPKPAAEPSQKVVRSVAKTKPKSQPSTTRKKQIALPSAGGNFEASVEQYIKDLRRKGKLASEEKTGWMVVDLTSGKSIVDINADRIFQAASMIKPFVALAFFHKVKHGTLKYGPKSRRNMELMIQRSNNPATNWVMRMAGGPAEVDKLLRTHYGYIFKDTRIVEFIPAGGRTYKNSALPSDYIRFLQALWSNKLPYGKEIRRLMSLPGRDRLYNGTPIPRGTLVYNKTGSTARLCGDMGILVAKDRKGNRYPYALVGIIERDTRASNYGNWMLTRGNVIRQVSTLVYKEMKKQYKLL
ncbi:MAG: serine hydrolase [Desulfocapsaceae bacterium]